MQVGLKLSAVDVSASFCVIPMKIIRPKRPESCVARASEENISDLSPPYPRGPMILPPWRQAVTAALSNILFYIFIVFL